MPDQTLAAHKAKFRAQIDAELQKIASGEMDLLLAQSSGIGVVISSPMLKKHLEQLKAQLDAGAFDEIPLDHEIDIDSYIDGNGQYFKRDKSTQSANERSFAVIRTKDGFSWRYEPKSKAAEEEIKIAGVKREGGFKSCKVAFGPNLTSYASLVTRYPLDGLTPDQISRIEQQIQNDQMEVYLNNQLARKYPQFFKHMDLIIERKQDQIVVRRYMEHMQYELFDLAATGILDKDYQGEIFPGLDRSLVDFNGTKIEKCMVDIIWQICLAIQAVHKSKIVHRDLKLENFMIGFDPISNRPVVTLIDFGAAREFGHAMRLSDGTENYYAPELFLIKYILMTDADITKHAQFIFKHANNRQDHATGTWIDGILGLEASLLLLRREPGYKVRSTNDQGQQDIWALGVLIYFLMNGHFPTVDRKRELCAPGNHNATEIEHIADDLDKILQLPILGGMFSLDPQHRTTIDDVVRTMQAQLPAELTQPPVLVATNENLVTTVTVEKVRHFFTSLSQSSEDHVTNLNNLLTTLNLQGFDDFTADYFTALGDKSADQVEEAVLHQGETLHNLKIQAREQEVDEEVLLYIRKLELAHCLCKAVSAVLFSGVTSDLTEHRLNALRYAIQIDSFNVSPYTRRFGAKSG